MHFALGTIVLVALGVDVGWQPAQDGSVEYIIQIEPELLRTLRPGDELSVGIRPELRDVRRYRIVVGDGQLPRDEGLLPEAKATEPVAPEQEEPAEENDPEDDESVLKLPVEPNGAVLERSEPAKPRAKQKKRTPPAELSPDIGAAPVDFEESQSAEQLELTEQTVSGEAESVQPENVANTGEPIFHEEAPVPGEQVSRHGHKNSGTSFAERSQAEPGNEDNRKNRETSPAERSQAEPGNEKTFASAGGPNAFAVVPSSEPRPWWPLTLALLGLFASLGGNVFLGWIFWEARRRYRELAENNEERR